MTRVEENLRLCLYSGIDTAADLDMKTVSGVYSTGPKYRGVMADAFNLFSDVLFSGFRMNYTSIVRSSVGILNKTSGFYDRESCLYSMQINETDVGAAIIRYPVQGHNLTPFKSYMHDKMYMLSRYAVEEKTHSSDCMKALAGALSAKLWLFFVLLVIAIWLLFIFIRHLSPKTQRATNQSMYQVIAHLLQKDTGDLTVSSWRILSLFLTLMSFFIAAYATNSLSTDIVVVVEPKIIRTYNDLLQKPRIRLVFPRLIDHFEVFESAPPNSKENRLWRKALKEVNGDKSKLLMAIGGSSPQEMFKIMKESAKQMGKVEWVAFLSQTFVTPAKKISCILKACGAFRRFKMNSDKSLLPYLRLYIWASQDADTKDELFTWVHSGNYKSPFATVLYKRANWAIALGFSEMSVFTLTKSPSLLTVQSREEGDVYRSCLDEDYRNNLPDVSFFPFSLPQYETPVLLFLTLMSIAFVCWASELFFREYFCPRPRRTGSCHSE